MVDVDPRDVEIRPVEEKDRPTVEWLTTQLWGAPEVAVHDGVFYPAALPGFIAERAGRIAGLVTYEVRGGTLEIATINALDLYRGIGTMLIEAVRAEAKRLGCYQVMLTTTNDNIGALRFYQRRGFRLVELRPGAVTRARRAKPEIPMTGEYGIPLRDELDLIRSVPLYARMSGRDPPGGRCRARSERAAHLRLLPIVRCRKRGVMRYTGKQC